MPVSFWKPESSAYLLSGVITPPPLGQGGACYARPDGAAWRQAVNALTDELERAEALDLSCVVIHPGSHLGAGVEAGLVRVVAALNEATRRPRRATTSRSRSRTPRGRAMSSAGRSR